MNGDQLQRKIKAAGLTKTEVARRLNVSSRTIRGYCSGEESIPEDKKQKLMNITNDGYVLPQTTRRRVVCLDTGEHFASMSEAADHYGVSRERISFAIANRQRVKSLQFALSR